MRGGRRQFSILQRTRPYGSCLLLTLVLASSCSSDEGPYGTVEEWECFEVVNVAAAGADGASGASGSGSPGVCDCYGVPDGERVSDSRPSVVSCGSWQCCYAWAKGDGRYDCRCEDAPPGSQVAAFCDAAASDRGGEVVDACPPTPRDNPTYCAAFGESCALEYLEDNDLSGCCLGSECGVDDFGTPVCKAAK